MSVFEPKAWRLLKSECAADCRVFKVLKNRFRHPDGREGDFFVNESSDWVQAIALVGGDKILLVNQFRFGAQKCSWELPGGVMEKGESPLYSAARELLEETGYAGENARLLASISPNPAIQSNLAHIVLVENCEKIADTNWDANEEIQVKLANILDLDKMVLSGEIHHSIAINCVYFLQKYLEGAGAR